MSETMEDDDNMIMLVVENEEDSNDDNDDTIDVPYPITIKIEPLDNSGNEVLESAHTEEKENNKEEFDIEFLEEDAIKGENEETEEYDAEYLEDLEEHPLQFELDDYDDDEDEDYCEPVSKKSKKMTLRKRTPRGKTQRTKPKRRKAPQIKNTVKKRKRDYNSFVKHLRKQYPEMAKNDQLIVEHLAGIMRETIPPDPPEDYCKVIEVEGENDKYECALCGAQRHSLPLAAQHYQFKHGEFYLTCFACGVKYRNTTNLYKHEKRCSAPDSKLVLRARGYYLGRKGRGRPFTTTNRFITGNMLMKKEYGRLMCTKCPATFSHQKWLVAHENSHDGVRPFRCHQCTMAYTSSLALQQHMKQHGDAQYICDHCGREFKLKPALVSHLDSHRPVRKHGCLYCERRFAQKTTLRHHMNKVHLNLPAAHGCPVCPKRYARISHVKEHMNRVHGLTMITRRMYFKALPSMTDEEVLQAKKLFNFKSDEIEETRHVKKEPEHILPDVLEEPTTDEYVQIIKKNKVKTEQNPVPEKTEPDSDVTTSEIVKTEPKRGKKKVTPKVEQPEDPKPKRIRKRPQFKRKIITEPIKVDEEIDDELCNIEYKRKRKTVNSAPEKQKTDDVMYKIVRDIKSTITNQKKVVNTGAEKKKSNQNFYELKRDFMNQLKKEIEIPEPEEEKPERSPQNLVPGTEIPENLVSWTKTPENIVSQNVESDNEEWKVYKDASEKNKVIADFLEYMKSGVVPKHVPILRRGRQTKET